MIWIKYATPSIDPVIVNDEVTYYSGIDEYGDEVFSTVNT
jgi:hypothetical protein